jgi:hypothetical protein
MGIRLRDGVATVSSARARTEDCILPYREWPAIASGPGHAGRSAAHRPPGDSLTGHPERPDLDGCG